MPKKADIPERITLSNGMASSSHDALFDLADSLSRRRPQYPEGACKGAGDVLVLLPMLLLPSPGGDGDGDDGGGGGGDDEVEKETPVL